MAKARVASKAIDLDLTQVAPRALSGLVAAGLIWAGLAFGAHAQDSTQGSDTITSYGIATLGHLKYPADYAHLDYVNPDAPKGGEISEWAPGGFDNYNPYSIQGRAAALSSVPLESLMEGTADTVGELYCLLCKSLEYPPSKDWVTFTLRDGIKFSDGTPLTAQDVVFSYEQLRDKGLSSFRAVIAQQVKSAKAIDDKHIRFDFQPDYPRRDIIQSVASLPIFSKAQFEKENIDLSQTSPVPFIGSGPYMFDSVKSNRAITWKRNPDYWGKDLPINKGRSNFDKIRVEYFGDYQSAFEGFKSGTYTFRNEASSIIWATAYDFPAMQSGEVVKAELPNGNIASGQGFAINLREPKFDDIRVREALGLVFNFEWSNDTLFYGLYDRVESFWENSKLQAQGKPSAEEKKILEPLAKDLPDGILTDDAVIQPVSGKRQLDRKNMRKAAKLLEEAGWTVGDDGMRRNNKGEKLTVAILNDSQTFDRVINPYVQNLRALGIDARMDRVDDSEYENRRRSHDFDMITTHLGQDEIPGSNLQQYFGSGSTDDVFNAMGLKNPAIDKMIRMVEEANTEEELLPRVHALDRSLRALRFWVPQWFKPTYTVAYYDMYDHPEKLPPYALGELDFWWYDADKAKKLKASGAL
ncbi:ABC transporter substrate-binding protein [Thioclava sp. F1Mire-8]|uniref:extracellular solute-binding protein n=1 Tax=Thioclava sp. F1Mire-8 TaxID=1973006 RepID=UPI000B544A39|nr:extracellular solute-binding protein [Thioclava sp. F1Mire-8]OWY05611.1 ABC transporter substrate-binding protein [Thioclava sp. F1Mire-8]